MNKKQIDKTSIQFESVYAWDAPDYCDAHIVAASFEDGTQLTDSQLDELNEDREFVYNTLQNYLN